MVTFERWSLPLGALMVQYVRSKYLCKDSER